MNLPERVEIAKTTQPPKRGRNLDKKDKASQKRPREMRNPQTINVDQPLLTFNLVLKKDTRRMFIIQGLGQVCTQMLELGHQNTLIRSLRKSR
jgi:hypothetical protein